MLYPAELSGLSEAPDCSIALMGNQMKVSTRVQALVAIDCRAEEETVLPLAE